MLQLADSVIPLIASHIKGTLAYLPPEFLRNKRLSTKLDVYSFGVVGQLFKPLPTFTRRYIPLYDKTHRTNNETGKYVKV